jgi:hypothetical protein
MINRKILRSDFGLFINILNGLKVSQIMNGVINRLNLLTVLFQTDKIIAFLQ